MAETEKRKFLYVEARGWFEDVQLTEGIDNIDALLLTDDPISFDSVVVTASCAGEAYDVGPAALKTQQDAATDQPTTSHATGTFLNDYVVAL